MRKSCSSKSSASPVKPGLRRSQSLNYQKVRSRQKLRYWSSRALSADAHTASTSLSSNHGKSYSSKPSAVLLGASSSCGPQKIDSLSSHCRRSRSFCVCFSWFLDEEPQFASLASLQKKISWILVSSTYMCFAPDSLGKIRRPRDETEADKCCLLQGAKL